MVNLVLPIRAAQAVFAIIVMGLMSYVSNWYTMDTVMFSPSQVNFLVFTSVFSLLSITYLEAVTRFMPRVANPYVALGLEGLNTLFYFAGFVAMAVFLNSLVFCRGTVCGSARASTAFSAFNWLLWSASAGLMAKDVMGKIGGFRRPQMRQGGGSQQQVPGVPLEKKETSEA